MSKAVRMIMRDVPAASEVLISSWVCSCESEVAAWFHCWSFGEYAEYPSSGEWIAMLRHFTEPSMVKRIARSDFR